MNDVFPIIYFLVVSLAGGILATACMTLVMLGIDRAGLTRANMIEAIGSMFTKTEANAQTIGAIVHFGSGAFFSFIYNIILGLTHVNGVLLSAITGAAIGFGHGFVMVFILIIAVAEHHPLEKYREAGPFAAAAHLVGHIVFGAVIGLVTGFSGIWNVPT